MKCTQGVTRERRQSDVPAVGADDAAKIKNYVKSHPFFSAESSWEFGKG